MTLVVCFLSFHYVLVYLLNYEFVDVWFLSQLYLNLGPGFNSILVPPLNALMAMHAIAMILHRVVDKQINGHYS